MARPRVTIRIDQHLIDQATVLARDLETSLSHAFRLLVARGLARQEASE